MAKAYDSWTVLKHGPIEKLTDNLWLVEGTLPNMGLSRKMVVVRMNDGHLVIHNGIALSDDAMKQIEAWGEPAFLIVPNGWHRLDAKAYKTRYPQLQVYCPRGAKARVEEVVAVDGTYDHFKRDETVQLLHLDGFHETEGVMRVQSPDGVSLVFNDAIFNLEHTSGMMGMVFRLMGSTGGPRVTPLTKWAVVKNRQALKKHLEQLSQEPDLRRILVSHGAPIALNAPQVLRQVAAGL